MPNSPRVLNIKIDESTPYATEASSLFILGPENPIRTLCYRIVCSGVFQVFILVCIVVNSVLLAVDQPKYTSPKPLSVFLNVMEIMFTAVFVSEMVLKVVALGLVLHSNSYLRNGWNVLDCIVAVTSILSLSLTSVGNYSALRVIRVLRPLRSVSRVKSLKNLIGGLFRALPMVFDNIVFLAFIMGLFAIAAVQFWVGSLNQRCYITDFTLNSTHNATPSIVSQYSSLANATPFLVRPRDDDRPQPCGGLNECGHVVDSTGVVFESKCEVHEEVFFERYMNYNNIGTASFLLLKVIVLDNWTDQLDDAMNVSGRWSAVIFYILLTLVGSVFCINLFLAILTDGYSKQTHELHLKSKGEGEAPAVTRHRHRMRDLTVNLMDCGANVDVEHDVLHSVHKVGYMDDAYRARKLRDKLERDGMLAPARDSEFEANNSTASLTRTSSGVTLVGGAAAGGGRSASLARIPSAQSLSPPVSPQIETTGPTSAKGRKVTFVPTSSGAVAGAPKLGRIPSANSFGSDSDTPPPTLNARRATVVPHSPTPTGSSASASITAFSQVGGADDANAPLPELLPGLPRTASFNAALDELTASSPVTEASSSDRGYDTDSVSYSVEEDEDDIQDRKDQITFAKILEEQGLLGALAAMEQTMDEIDDDPRAPWRKSLGSYVEGTAASLFMLFISVANMVFLAVDHYGIDKTIALVMGYASVACTVFVALHLLLKVVAWGPLRTFEKGFNKFDFVMIALSIPDMYFSGGGSSMFSVLRAFRMIRVIRILRNFQSLQAITETLLSSGRSVGYLFLLILLNLYIFAIMGMQLFGVEYGRNENARESFGSIWEALLTCFVIISGDGWTEKMVLSMSSGKEQEVTSIFYFVGLYMISNYILINLFVAIILDKLNSKMAQLEENELVMPNLILPVFQGHQPGFRSQDGNTAVSGGSANLFSLGVSPLAGNSGSGSHPYVTGNGMLLGNAGGAGATSGNHSHSHSLSGTHGFIDDITSKKNSWRVRANRAAAALLYVRPIKVVEDSLYLFSPQNDFRRLLLHILGSTLFEGFITANVFASMIFLCFESARNTAETNLLLDRANYFFTAVFCVEMGMKIVAFGWFFPKAETDPSVTDPHQPAYFRDPWNWVDAIINVLSFASLRLNFFRSARSLRTIRLTIRNEKTKLIIVAMLQSIPHVFQGLIFVAFLFFVFGIIGVQLFKGEFYMCNDPAIWAKSDCHGNFTSTLQGPVLPYNVTLGRSWDRQPYHFDHLGASILSLFVVAIGDAWSKIMYFGIDSTSPGFGPRRDNEPWIAFYFCIVFVCMNFFSFNMIVGILINYFSKMKQKNDGSALLTPDQRLYVKARHSIDSIMFSDDMIPLDPRICQALGRLLRYRRPNSSADSVPLFDIGMTVVIIVNTIVIAITHKDMVRWEVVMIETVNQVALAIFALEMGIKLIAFGPRQYLLSAWNRFDALIVVAGFVSIGLRFNALSFMRVLRIIKLVRRSSIERLLINVVRSFNSFVNVLALLILTFFVFAVAGVILWGNVKRNGRLTELHNFDNVPNAMVVLYQIAMTEGMAEFMTACSLEKPDCEPIGDGTYDNCGNQAASLAYYLAFMVACTFTVLQLFVAVVVEIFTDDFNEDDPIVIGFQELKQVWTQKLGAGVNIITLYQLVEVLPQFPMILTDLTYDYRPADMIRVLSCLQIPIDSQYRVTYRDIVYALAWKKYNIDVRSLGTVINEAIFSFVTTAVTESFTAAEGYAALLIQQRWARHKQRIYEQNMVLVRMSQGAGGGGGGGAGAADLRLPGLGGRKRYTLHRKTAAKSNGSSPARGFRAGANGPLGGDANISTTAAEEWYDSTRTAPPELITDGEDASTAARLDSPGARGALVGGMFAPQPLFLHFGDVVEPRDGDAEGDDANDLPSADAQNPLAGGPSRVGTSKYGLARSIKSPRNRRKSAAAVAAAVGEMMDQSLSDRSSKDRVAPSGAVYVPGCSLYSFIPLVDEAAQPGGGGSDRLGVGPSSLGSSARFGAAGSRNVASDPTGIFNPDFE